MAVLTTKYSVGDTVWHANITTTQKSHPCPDCLGSRKWACRSPAGGEFEVPCIRCSTSYRANHALSLSYAAFVPAVLPLTIGMVKASTETGDSYDAGNTYMCQETGVGSGSVYRENTLLPTKEEAMSVAQIKADLQNADQNHWVAKQYNETAEFCDYQLKDAEIEAAKSASSRALSAVGYLLEDLDEAESMEDVRQRIADWREKRAA